jgi:hypothetical protein
MTATPPQYSLEHVERAVLEEIETAVEAAHSLRASGLVRYRNDDRVVEAAHATLRVAALLGSP